MSLFDDDGCVLLWNGHLMLSLFGQEVADNGARKHKQQENQEAQRIAFLDFSDFLFLFFDAVICVHNAAKLQKICYRAILIIVKE